MKRWCSQAWCLCERSVVWIVLWDHSAEPSWYFFVARQWSPCFCEEKSINCSPQRTMLKGKENFLFHRLHRASQYSNFWFFSWSWSNSQSLFCHHLCRLLPSWRLWLPPAGYSWYPLQGKLWQSSLDQSSWRAWKISGSLFWWCDPSRNSPIIWPSARNLFPKSPFLLLHWTPSLLAVRFHFRGR